MNYIVREKSESGSKATMSLLQPRGVPNPSNYKFDHSNSYENNNESDIEKAERSLFEQLSRIISREDNKTFYKSDVSGNSDLLNLLSIRSEAFVNGFERAIWIPIERDEYYPDAGADYMQDVQEICFRQTEYLDNPRKSALVVATKEKIIQIDLTKNREEEDLVEHLLNRAMKILPERNVQVYKTPQQLHQVKRDKFWSKSYYKKNRAPSKAYQAYRDSIDGLLIDCIEEHNLDTSRVVEICCGDASFANILLRHKTCVNTAYIGFERNPTLVKLGQEKLLKICEENPKISGKVIQVDLLEVETDYVSENVDVNLATLIVASGSILNAQVGNFENVLPTLRSLSKALAPNGRIILTGFTGAMVFPKLFHEAGLAVISGSIPCIEADNYETDISRLQMFVCVHSDEISTNGQTSLKEFL